MILPEQLVQLTYVVMAPEERGSQLTRPHSVQLFTSDIVYCHFVHSIIRKQFIRKVLYFFLRIFAI